MKYEIMDNGTVKSLETLESEILSNLVRVHNNYCENKIKEIGELYDLSNFCRTGNKDEEEKLKKVVGIAVEMLGVFEANEGNNLFNEMYKIKERLIEIMEEV